ncbi:MAG: recombinase family protein [Snowella sp.]|nr:recombinase family protein [Snowella sp.]
MSGISIWLRGITRSGKTSCLIDHFTIWMKQQSLFVSGKTVGGRQATALIFAANENSRRSLADRLVLSLGGDYPIICKTPLGFMGDEVILFWPLIFEARQLTAQFPLRLRPETEQELATRLWQQVFAQQSLSFPPSQEYRLIRDTLDLMQLAGAAGIAVEEIAPRLEVGWPDVHHQDISPQQRGTFLIAWRNWCLERGLLTYGLISELYWRYLLPNAHYQQQLLRRYQGIFADDVDDYPAIAKDLSEFLLKNGVSGVFTYNPHAQIRLGLNADTQYWEGLATYCQIEQLPDPQNLATEWATPLLTLVTDPFFNRPIPDRIQSIQTTSRAKLLRQTANFIIDAVHAEEIKPEEIAIIAPGLDEIARYSLIEILTAAKIPINPLNEQRSLISSPFIRALLTLLALIYPHLGKLALRDDVAEMLVILSQKPEITENLRQRLIADIDPVRAGLIADHCYQIDFEQPQLLPIETFARWDRIGYRATTAYQQLVDWIETAKNHLQSQPQANTPILVLDRAMRELLPANHYLTYDQVSVLRELMETAQHFWEVERRLHQSDAIAHSVPQQLQRFIQLLRRGTITANPRPRYSLGKEIGSITLATIFQYRSLRKSHRWQFWLDAGSSLWIQGGAAQLFAAPVFLQNWSGEEWNSESAQHMDQARLERIVWDLFGRAEERIFLCHSDLSVRGTEQLGPFLSLIQRAEPAIADNGVLTTLA